MLPRPVWHRASQRALLPNTRSIRPALFPLCRTSYLGLTSSSNVRNRYVSLQASEVGEAAGEAGESKTGHISAGPNEGIFFFNNVYPVQMRKILGLPAPKWLFRMVSPTTSGTDPNGIIEKANAKQSLQITPTEILPRMTEGGAFVKFTHGGTASAIELEKALQQCMRDAPIKPWWSPWRRMRAKLVHGKPWVEDLMRLPTSRLRVEFISGEAGAPATDAVELSQEQLFQFFRPYGKLADIVIQPPDSKILPKFAYLDYSSLGKAIMAKNCMHGYVVSEAEGGGKKGTVLRLTYEEKVKPRYIRDWIFSHPRIIIPIIAALLAGTVAVVFDPIRTFFVKAHITRYLHLEDNKWYQWLKGYATNIIRGRKHSDDDSYNAIWDDRKENIEQIQTWLMESADTFIIVQGPHGSGKRELVLDQALYDKKIKLVVDCKSIQEARGDSATINAAALAVGYRPVFSWMNNISGMIDLAAQGAAGVKTGFSETLDAQLNKIWNTTSTALRQIALDTRHKSDKDANLGDDAWLEAHPERRPIVVIDNFLHKAQEGGIVYDRIAEWAAGLTSSNVAHVIFLTHDVAFSKSLSKALPDRVFRLISLSDCSPEAAKLFVIKHLEADFDDDQADALKESPHKKHSLKHRTDLAELDESIHHIGGRLTDLEFLARRIKTGERPNKAVHEIIDQSASEILKMYIFDAEDDSGKKHWNAEQAWILIRALAQNESVRYNEIALDDILKSGGESVLRALEQAELISIVSGPNGRPSTIRPGKPVYYPAFKRLTEDKVLSSRLDLSVLTSLSKIENTTIEKCENELLLLSKLKSQPAQTSGRVHYLLAKMATSQDKVEKYELEMKALKKVLGEEY